jgi:fumarate reductase subunit C
MIGFVAAMQFFFTAGDGFSGAGTVKITWQPFTLLASQGLLTLPYMLMKIGVGRIPAGMIGFAVIALFQAAFLTPALLAYLHHMRKNLRDMREKLRDVDILLLGSGIAGLSGFFLTEAPEFSHISFLHFSSISFVLLGARGLQLMIEGKLLESASHRYVKIASYVAIVLLGCVHLAQVPLHSVAWLGRHWAEAAINLVGGSSVALPQLASCMKQEDADLFARAAEESSAAIVIPIYPGTNCASIWWVARRPIRTLNAYMMQHVPGRATDPALRVKIETQREHFFQAFEAASKGVLNVANVITMAMTLIDKGPVFVMAPRALSVEQTGSLQLVGSSEAFSLWRVSIPPGGK